MRYYTEIATPVGEVTVVSNGAAHRPEDLLGIARQIVATARARAAH